MITLAAAASFACVGGIASPAMATRSPAVDIIAGYTETEFVEAANHFGYANLAAGAWGDLEEMSQIPIASVTETGPTATIRTAKSSTDARSTLFGSCQQIVRNLLGNNIYVLRVNKYWETDGQRVYELSSAHATETAWGWNYDDLVAQQEYYQPLGSAVYGMHISHYAAKFTHAVPPPESRTIWASVNASTVGHGCSGGES